MPIAYGEVIEAHEVIAEFAKLHARIDSLEQKLKELFETE